MIKKVCFWLLFIALSILFLYLGSSLFTPDVQKLKNWHPPLTSFMKYRMKEWEHQGKKRKIIQTWVNISQISPYAVKATIIAEDDKFWSHDGFDFEAMQKALATDLKKKRFKVGGSTISQQLVKNLYLTPEKSVLRKIREAIITWRIERRLSKKRIIELYLNVAEWGDGIFGIEAAARRYYGKPALSLTAYEAARLVSVLPNPRKYRPDGTSGYVGNRSAVIMRIMAKRGIVIPEYEAVIKEPDGAAQAETSNGQEKEKKDGGTGDAPGESGVNAE